MYRNGHIGVSLLVFAPIGYGLVAVDEIEAALLTGAVMVWLAMLPDIDHRIPLIAHRGPTHSLAFAGLVGGLFAVPGIVLETTTDGSNLELAGFGFLLGFLTVLAHLIGDTLTPAGVNYFWPLSTKAYSLSLTRADNALANGGLFALGVFITAAWVAVALGLV